MVVAMTTLDFLVQKNQLAATFVRSTPDPVLSAGDIRVRIDKFALTSNNITYAAFGEAMNYWAFFPVNDPDDGLDRAYPGLGFATVLQSLHPDVTEGDRFYGYFPMSSGVVLRPGNLRPSGFMDVSPHRASLHSVYNQYLRCEADPFYTHETEDLQALLRPLFVTSWLIDDFLADNDFFGGTAGGQPALLVLSSASSKTAYGTAFQLARRSGVEVVGLTSVANKEFCESLGCYDRVLGYEQLAQLDASRVGIYIDFAGNAELRRAVHSRFDNLRYSSSIGGTHVDQLGGAKDLPGPKPTLFFAPAQIKKRSREWGAPGLEQRLLAGWRNFVGKVNNVEAPWLTVQHHQGAVAAEAAYRETLRGRGHPRQGHMLTLN